MHGKSCLARPASLGSTRGLLQLGRRRIRSRQSSEENDDVIPPPPPLHSAEDEVRTMLILAAQHGWHTIQIDYVLAFPQAPIEKTLYMEVPKGFEIEGCDHRQHCLKLHKNVYGSKNAGRTWYQYLTKKLIEEVGFVQSKVDECVFYKGNVMYILYTDDSVLAGPDRAEIESVIEDIKRAKLDITVEGDIQDFLGINIKRKEDGSIHLTQPHLIDGVLEDLRLTGDSVHIKATPDILRRHAESEAFDGSFDYRSVIGKLNYLERGTRADISYITHQCARYAVSPKREHGEGIKWFGRYPSRECIREPSKERRFNTHSMAVTRLTHTHQSLRSRMYLALTAGLSRRRTGAVYFSSKKQRSIE
jgi:hypothetical protein